MAEAGPAPTDALNPIDPVDLYVEQVLAIIPDVDPLHVAGLVERFNDSIVERIVNLLLETPDYPKVQNKGKGKRKRDEEEQEGSDRAKSVKIDYASKDRHHMGGMFYYELAIEQLGKDFPFIPMAHVRRTFSIHNSFYAPTFLALQSELRSGVLPYQRLTSGSAASRSRNKGKQVEKIDEELEREKQWVRMKAVEERTIQDQQIAEDLQDAEDCQIECACCFSEYPIRKVVQCPDAHLFCRDCMSSYCETKLGEHDINIICMDQSGCKLAFTEEELKKVLSGKLLELYYRVKQRKEIEAAGVENLAECPFCDYKVIIENPEERLFRCARDECGVVSCRACKKPDHLPKNCEEAETDKKLDARHTVEEAMTQALIRSCPNPGCDKVFTKEAGCNKMTCTNCRTMSCYVCRKVIKGYEHFNQAPGNSRITDATKCPLWDTNPDQRHADEVAAAAKRAMEEMKRANPEVDEKDLQVELPKPVAGPSKGPGHPAHQPPQNRPQHHPRYRMPPQPLQPPPAPRPQLNLQLQTMAQEHQHLQRLDMFRRQREAENLIRLERVRAQGVRMPFVHPHVERHHVQAPQRALPAVGLPHNYVPARPTLMQPLPQVARAPGVSLSVNGHPVAPANEAGRDFGDGSMMFLFRA
ncbi:hypothetical protein BDY19DRAFT_1031916 [Irpex rosettiformis]|uniref:Uncharacterized protein n=1 Tax=Irpex rosettiformis TaxID=378272 RepID=A0ACB8TNQ8_9APHY|nr:hypothetical protein BDY19DRAFT_1031916 [Irpex rosettiformis]